MELGLGELFVDDYMFCVGGVGEFSFFIFVVLEVIVIFIWF